MRTVPSLRDWFILFHFPQGCALGYQRPVPAGLSFSARLDHCNFPKPVLTHTLSPERSVGFVFTALKRGASTGPAEGGPGYNVNESF